MKVTELPRLLADKLLQALLLFVAFFVIFMGADFTLIGNREQICELKRTDSLNWFGAHLILNCFFIAFMLGSYALAVWWLKRLGAPVSLNRRRFWNMAALLVIAAAGNGVAALMMGCHFIR